MGDIVWNREAQIWLQDIHEFVARDNPRSAGKVIAGILERTQLLRDLPELGYRYSGQALQHVRILLYGQYRIAYLIRTDEDIEILGVFHGALDLDRYLL